MSDILKNLNKFETAVCNAVFDAFDVTLKTGVDFEAVYEIIKKYDKNRNFKILLTYKDIGVRLIQYLLSSNFFIYENSSTTARVNDFVHFVLSDSAIINEKTPFDVEICLIMSDLMILLSSPDGEYITADTGEKIIVRGDTNLFIYNFEKFIASNFYNEFTKVKILLSNSEYQEKRRLIHES